MGASKLSFTPMLKLSPKNDDVENDKMTFSVYQWRCTTLTLGLSR